MSDVIATARALLERITFDVCGVAGKGGNGGLVSTETVKAADQLRLAISRHEVGNEERELAAARAEVTRLNRELFRASVDQDAAPGERVSHGQ